MDRHSPETLLRHAAWLRRLARRLAHDDATADDLVQETWLAAVRRPPERPVAPRRWLARVLRNRVARRYRDDVHRVRREARVAHAERVPPSQEKLVLSAELQRHIIDAVLLLNEPLRTTVLLRFFEGWTPREIAQHQQTPVTTVRSRLTAALRKLRRRLDRSYAGDRNAWVAIVPCLALDPNHCAPVVAASVPNASSASGSAFSLAGLQGIVIGGTFMGMKKPLAISGVLLVLLGGVAWLSWDRTRRDGGDSPAETGSTIVIDTEIETIHEPADRSVATETAQTAEIPEVMPVEGAVETQFGTLRVAVVWAESGAAAAGVWLRLVASTREDSSIDTELLRTNTEGVAEFIEVNPGPVEVLGVRGGRLEADVQVGEVTDRTLEIPRGIGVTGIVVSREGSPVERAAVWVSRNADWIDGAPVVQTDSEGLFAIDSVGPFRFVGARAAGHAPSPLVMLRASEGASAELRLELRGRGAVVEGLVLDSEGTPVADAVVQLQGGIEERKLVSVEGGYDGELASIIRTRSGEDGRFRFSGVVPGELFLSARTAGFAPWKSPVSVDESEATFVTLRLERGFALSGIVRSPTGAPVEGALVRAGGGYFRDLGTFTTETDAEGYYQLIRLPAGTLPLLARFDGLGQAKGQIEGRSGEAERWDASLSKWESIRGVVLDDDDGKPLVDWNVIVSAEAPTDATQPSRTKTSGDGSFELENCPDVPHRLSLYAPGSNYCLYMQRGVRPGSELTIRVRGVAARLPSAFVRGRLLDAEQKPVGNADVTVWPEGAQSVPFAHPDAETGRFEVGPLPPGKCRIEIEVRGYAKPRIPSPELAPHQTHDLGDIVLDVGATLVVELSLDDGSPLGAPNLSVLSERLDGSREYWRIERQEDDTARATGLPSGRYRVLAYGEGVALTETAFTIAAGDEVKRLRAVLRRGVERTLRLDVPPSSGETTAARAKPGLTLGGAAPRSKLRIYDGFDVLVHERWYSPGAAIPEEHRPTLAVGDYRVEAERDGVVYRSQKLFSVVNLEPSSEVIRVALQPSR